MSLSHATEKFGGAHGTLLTGQGVIRERLRNAAMEILRERQAILNCLLHCKDGFNLSSNN